MNKFTNKVAIVTGSSKGIGAGIAARLANEGASVIVNYTRNESEATEVVNRIISAGGKAISVKADISKPGQSTLLIDAALAAFGRLDILVNNAGTYKLDSLDTISEESISEHFDLNVRGLILMTQAAARVLSPGGVIINISSGVATSPSPHAHVYCATKGAVNVLTRTLAMELGPKKIRVVGIAPGFVVTEGNSASADQYTEYYLPKTPLGRVGKPADIASVVSFAASDDADWVTGCTIDVAGGMVF